MSTTEDLMVFLVNAPVESAVSLHLARDGNLWVVTYDSLFRQAKTTGNTLPDAIADLARMVGA